MAGKSRRYRKIKLGLALLCLTGSLSGLTGCVSVKEYQKMYLNADEMALKDRKVDAYGKSITTYREGASGADGGKTGGGCGCN